MTESSNPFTDEKAVARAERELGFKIPRSVEELRERLAGVKGPLDATSPERRQTLFDELAEAERVRRITLSHADEITLG